MPAGQVLRFAWTFRSRFRKSFHSWPLEANLQIGSFEVLFNVASISGATTCKDADRLPRATFRLGKFLFVPGLTAEHFSQASIHEISVRGKKSHTNQKSAYETPPDQLCPIHRSAYWSWS